MSDTKITCEEAQAEIDGLLVAEICRDFGTNFHGVYPNHILARGVGPEQAFIGLAIKRGHLAPAIRIADLTRQLAEARDAALEEAAVAAERTNTGLMNDGFFFGERVALNIRNLKGPTP